jgi:VWFA-related protein
MTHGSIRAFVVCAVAAGLSISSPDVRAQDPPSGATPPGGDQRPGPIFRGGTTFVSVDAYPRLSGTIVEGLTADDFVVLEDGVPQAVEAFQFIRIEPNAPDDERRDPNTQADGDRQAADPRARVFVVYLDLTHTTIPGSHYAREPILQFLTRTIGRNDLFGVLTAELPVSHMVFARRTETLEDELLRHWPWGQAGRLSTTVRTPQERRLFECGHPDFVEQVLIPLWREDQMMTSLEHLMLRLGGLRDERKNVLFISEGWVPRGPRPELLSATRGEVPKVGVGPGGTLGIGRSMQPWGEARSWCDGEISRLASIDFDQRFRELLTSANQANVSFYPIDVGGLRTMAPVAEDRVLVRDRPRLLGRAIDTLRTLAENTDGFSVVNTNDLADGARRIGDDLAAFYLLGYYSTNPAANGRFRRIEVKVNRPRVQVSARRGYLAPTAEMLAAASAARVETAPSPTDLALAPLAVARNNTELFAVGVARPDHLQIAVELPAAILRDGFGGGAQVRAIVTSPDGAEASATAPIATGERFTAVTIPLTPGTMPDTWQVQVHVQASGGDRRLEQRLQIAAHRNQLIGAAVAWRAASLSPRAPLSPLVDPRLSRRERIRVEWPVIASADRYEARLLDRAGRPLGEPLPLALPGDAGATVTLDLPLGALPEGDYVVELAATRGGVTERELLAVRVVR